ncbi:hypothetical protein Pan216_41380 [Planctomycetes bacterium Pan216]|uniref:FG-GAP repeat protein n=1 Tax=Kolteria novifilia TaxID=2527975 RepID=A0A518B8G6_9BACT|nr:hypothetical protein Pan216_41380 [Planctomycetes bacterium Pan216]
MTRYRETTGKRRGFGFEDLESRVVPAITPADLLDMTEIPLGHVDLGLNGGGGSFSTGYHVSGSSGVLPLETTYVSTDDRALRTVPSGFDFLGATAGSDIYLLPQQFTTETVWLGWSAEDSSPGGFDEWTPNGEVEGRWIEAILSEVRGPGEFSLWRDGGTPVVFLTTADGIDPNNDVFPFPVGGHQHTNWAFTEAGIYEIDLHLRTDFVGGPDGQLTQTVEPVTLIFAIDVDEASDPDPDPGPTPTPDTDPTPDPTPTPTPSPTPTPTPSPTPTPTPSPPPTSTPGVTDPDLVIEGDGVGLYVDGYFHLRTNDLRDQDRSIRKVFEFGASGDVGFVFDADQNGTPNLAVFRPSTAEWIVNVSELSDFNPELFRSYAFGNPGGGDRPIVGDWDGDGFKEIGVHRPASASFSLDLDGNLRYTDADVSVTFGNPFDEATIGHFLEGVTFEQLAIRRGAEWVIADTSVQSFVPTSYEQRYFGLTDDVALPGDWNNDGYDELGVRRDITFYLDYDSDDLFTLGADIAFSRSIANGDQALVWTWDDSAQLDAILAAAASDEDAEDADESP